MEPSIRILLSRDDFFHQRGYWVISNALRNAGVEVVLGGIQTPIEIVETALQEDVDIIGYRIMQASPKVIIPILFEKMKERGIEDIPVVVGGIVPEKEEPLIRDLGVKEIFHPHTSLELIVKHVKDIGRDYILRKRYLSKE